MTCSQRLENLLRGRFNNKRWNDRVININFPSSTEEVERYFARLSNFPPFVEDVDFVMEKDIWRGIKAIRKESGRFRFPFSPFCFTLLNRESRKIGGVIVGDGKMVNGMDSKER